MIVYRYHNTDHVIVWGMTIWLYFCWTLFFLFAMLLVITGRTRQVAAAGLTNKSDQY